MNESIQVTQSSMASLTEYIEEIKDLWESRWLRKAIYERYIENLHGIDGNRLPYIPKEVVSNYAYFPVLFDSLKTSRDEIHHELIKQGIYSRKYLYPLTNQLECYQSKFTPNTTPVAQQISENILSLPIYPDLKIEDVDLICNVIKDTKYSKEVV